jgi:sec-independent protein translocase protein TatA
MGALQPGHLILVLAIVLVIFGPRKLGDIGKSLGEGMRELRKASSETVGDQGTSAMPASAASTRSCAECHGAVSLADKFCGHCGHAMPA